MRHNCSGALDRNRGIITPEQQRALTASKVLIAGVGGVGGRTAETLARTGIGTLRITDPDTYSVTNLNRQAGATLHTIGTKKADVIAKLCRDIGTGTLVEYDECGVTQENAGQLVTGIDLVIDGTDYTAPHAGFALARAARAHGIPLLTAVEIGYGAWHTVFQPGGFSYDKFFGVDESISLADLEEGRVEIPFWRWVASVPRYADLTTLSQVEARALDAPAIAPAVELSAALLTASAIAVLTGRRPVVEAPRIHHIDLWTGRAGIKRPRFASFYLSVARAHFNRRTQACRDQRIRIEK